MGKVVTVVIAIGLGIAAVVGVMWFKSNYEVEKRETIVVEEAETGSMNKELDDFDAEAENMGREFDELEKEASEL